MTLENAYRSALLRIGALAAGGEPRAKDKIVALVEEALRQKDEHIVMCQFHVTPGTYTSLPQSLMSSRLAENVVFAFGGAIANNSDQTVEIKMLTEKNRAVIELGGASESLRPAPGTLSSTFCPHGVPNDDFCDVCVPDDVCIWCRKELRFCTCPGGR